jgi:hypothetical protein
MRTVFVHRVFYPCGWLPDPGYVHVGFGCHQLPNYLLILITSLPLD